MIIILVSSNYPNTVKAIYRVIMLLLFVPIGAASGQVCPGGGANFLTAVAFDPAWIYGCNTGTSCNGGVAFDNRNACEPITLIDACAPAPSCGTAGNTGSDIWFKFFASGPTAKISCFQNTSLVLGIQAFSGNLTCGSLVEMGCAVSGGPSSGVQLPLSGLTPGTLYYFRIFGNANPVSQRTGLYCFCGSTGLGVFNLLPLAFNTITAQQQSGRVAVTWTASNSQPAASFYIERSGDGTSFTTIGQLPAAVNSNHGYLFTDDIPLKGTNYYRIRTMSAVGNDEYSKTVVIRIDEPAGFRLLSNAVNEDVTLANSRATVLLLSDISGKTIQRIQLSAGKHVISTSQLSNGIYLLHDGGNTVQKFFVNR